MACDKDAGSLQEMEGWVKIAAQTPKLRGFMYLPKQKNYSLLPGFADLLRKPEPRPATGAKKEESREGP